MTPTLVLVRYKRDSTVRAGTWNLDEQRREGEQKDYRHTPQVEVARRAYFRRHVARYDDDDDAVDAILERFPDFDQRTRPLPATAMHPDRSRAQCGCRSVGSLCPRQQTRSCLLLPLLSLPTLDYNYIQQEQRGGGGAAGIGARRTLAVSPTAIFDASKYQTNMDCSLYGSGDFLHFP